MEERQGSVYQFDQFSVDPARRLLLGPDGLPLPLTPKAFDTLLCLVQSAGAVLEKEAIIEAVWPNMAVEENNLSQNISTLRRVLGGNRKENRFIVTAPGRGYSFVATVTNAPAAKAGASTALPQTIAVLPFKPVVAEHRDAPLEIGMAETLITKLSCIQQMVVRPLSSVRRYADLEQDPLVAGRELRVDSVLEGHLQRCGEKIRATVRLVNVGDGSSIWADSFDEPFTDIFELQDAIGERVVKALAVYPSRTEQKRSAKRFTESSEAYQYYLKGRYSWWKSSPQEFRKSREYFHKAVDCDPQYALGYCGLNSYYGFGAAWGLMPPEQGWLKAEWANNKALELDDKLAEAHLGLAAFKMIAQRDWKGAERAAKQGIELNPLFEEIHYFYSFYLMVSGRFDEALAECKHALACDPFSLRINQHFGDILYYAGRFDDAIRQYQQTIELEPKNHSAHQSLGDAYEHNEQLPEALQEWHRAMVLSNDVEMAAIFQSVNQECGFKEALKLVAAKTLERLQKRVKEEEFVPAISFARVYARLEDDCATLEWMARTSAEKNAFALMMERDPLFRKAREADK
jgi:DNA-binding winged helix-turn-helix (wHTH) protein/tetratricopeptide (TPR) repeat protein